MCLLRVMQGFGDQRVCEVMHEMQCGHRLLLRYLECLIVFIETALMKMQKIEFNF